MGKVAVVIYTIEPNKLTTEMVGEDKEVIIYTSMATIFEEGDILIVQILEEKDGELLAEIIDDNDMYPFI